MYLINFPLKCFWFDFISILTNHYKKEMLIIIKRFCNIRFDFTSFICLWFLCTEVNFGMESKGKALA